MNTTLAKLIASISLLATLTACFPRSQPLEPEVCYTAKERDLKQLKSPFPTLIPYEKQQAWGHEYHLGVQFARECDYYRAITNFRMALFDQPPPERKIELLYFITLSYWLAGRCCEAIDTFENSSLARVEPTFAAYKELLIVLYECYFETGQQKKASFILEQMDDRSAELGTTIRSGKLEGNPIAADYCRCRKSVQKAQVLSAILPGAGYLYVGQKATAITAFFLNALFIWGTVEFFRRGFYAAGIFTLSLEAGWYFGGIWGAAEAAHYYNTRLYERLACQKMKEKRLFPIFQLRYSF